MSGPTLCYQDVCSKTDEDLEATAKRINAILGEHPNNEVIRGDALSDLKLIEEEQKRRREEKKRKSWRL